MAEFLIRAQGHWQDAWNQAKINSLTDDERRQFYARTQLGDIIVVKPNNWNWGREEGLPKFVIVKIPDMTVEEAEEYIQSITEDYIDGGGQPNTRNLRFRKWFLKPTWINTIISQGGVYTIDKATVLNYIEAKVL